MKHRAKRGAICVCWKTSHSGQDMKKARTSFQMQWNVMRTHILFAVRSPALTDSNVSCYHFP